MEPKFLVTTPEEMHDRGWDQLDVILISGDSYIDSPYIGVAVIGRVFGKAGFRVGIIAQPDFKSEMTSLDWVKRACSGGDRGKRGFHGGQYHCQQKKNAAPMITRLEESTTADQTGR